jgi:hypothetical protein
MTVLPETSPFYEFAEKTESGEELEGGKTQFIARRILC